MENLTGKTLKMLRKCEGISQQDLANAVGVSVTTIKKWEGGAKPQQKHYERLIEVVETLFGEECPFCRNRI